MYSSVGNCCLQAWDNISKKINQNAADIAKLKTATETNSAKIQQNSSTLDQKKKSVEAIDNRNIVKDAAKSASRAAIAEIADIESRKKRLIVFKLKESSVSLKDETKRNAHSQQSVTRQDVRILS